MNGQQWLLIGGPAHGVVHEVFFSTRIRWDHEGRDYVYIPETYYCADDKQSYVIARCQMRPDEVDWLIQNRKVQPIVWEEQKGPKRLE